MNIREMDSAYIAHTYGRANLLAQTGSGATVYDETGKKYIDLGSGIGVNAFAGNRNITSIELPEGIAYIREGAFSGCTALKEINIPASVKAIGDSAFKGCTALKLPLKVKLRFMGSKLFG